MSAELSAGEQKQGKKKVEVHEAMQKGQPLWCASEILLLVFLFLKLLQEITHR